MDWARWLRDFAIFGGIAGAALAVLRTAAGAAAVARVRAAVASWSPRKAIAVVLLLTAATRVAGLATFEPPWDSDVEEYVVKAERIADEGSPRSQEVRGERVFYRPMGSSLALAGWYRLTGTRGLASARVHGILLACVAAWLIVVLGRTILRETEGRLAALAYAVFLPHVVFASIPYTETFVTVLVLGVSVLFERLRRDTGGWRAAAGIGLLGGWIAITRTEIAWLAPLAFVVLAWERRHEWTEVVAPAVLALALFAVPVVVNHEMRAGYPGTLRTSVQGGLILYFGNNPIDVPGHGNATLAVQEHVQALYARDATGGLARDEAIAWIWEHPVAAIGNSPKKAFHLWLAEPQGFRWHAGVRAPGGMDATLAVWLRSAAYVQSLVVLFAAVAGWRLLGAERSLWTTALVLHLAVWCLLAASTRNRYPFEPWLLLAVAALTARAHARTR